MEKMNLFSWITLVLLIVYLIFEGYNLYKYIQKKRFKTNYVKKERKETKVPYTVTRPNEK